MHEATVIPPGGGEVIGDSPERRVEILCDDEALNATWSRFAAGRAGADLHVHRHHNDIFYVLEGELTVMLGLDGEHVVVPAGTVALVPPLVVHGFRNASDADARYLNFHAPGRRFADYMRGLRDGRPFTYDQEPPPADGGRPTGLAVVGGSVVDVEEIVVREVSAAAGAGTAAARREQLQCFYVLDGELVLAAGDRELRAAAGAWVQVPAGAAYELSFPAAARYLELRAPR